MFDRNRRSKKCDDVLFADFKVNYNCANAIAEFVDGSGGSPDQWQWSFANSVANSRQNPKYSFDKSGTYPVSLTVSKGGNSQTYATNVLIRENTIPENSIAINNETMTSLLIANKYEWMKDGETIVEARQRSYSYNGDEGLYVVVVYDDQCNLPSDTVTITGIGMETNLEISIYPNPVSDKFTISSASEIQNVEVMDIMGRTVYSQQANGNIIQIEMQHLPASIYFVNVLCTDRKIRKRILVKH